MDKKERKRLFCGLLAGVMLLSGCAQRGGAAKETTGSGDSEYSPAISAGSLNIRNDAVIREHLENNRGINTQRVDREAGKFRLYVENSKMMAGFVPENGSASSIYQESILSLKDVISNSGFQEKEAFVLSAGAKDGVPEWEAANLDTTLSRMHSKSFYTDVEIPEVSPLGVMGEPFEENSLTAIVTSLMEPNNDLSAVATGIRTYFDRYENSAACLMGMTSDFEGTYYIPAYAGEEQWRIENILRDNKNSYPVTTPFYLLIVGPEPAVRKFADDMAERLNKKNIVPAYGVFTNNVYSQVIHEPLHFRVLEDLKLKKAGTDIIRSYNTGALYQDGNGGSVFYADSGQRVKTLDADVDPGKNVRISNSTQVSVMSEDYDGQAVYTEEHTLYEFDAAANKWVKMEKNAQDNAYLTMTTERGELRDDYADEVILSSGKQIRISAKLDFSSTSPLKREKTYRMEVRLRLNQANPDAASDAGEQLRSLGINRKDYLAKVNTLTAGAYSNYIWTASFNKSATVAPALSKTPNLEELLTSLEALEGEYVDTREVIQYVDFVFNVPAEEQ